MTIDAPSGWPSAADRFPTHAEASLTAHLADERALHEIEASWRACSADGIVAFFEWDLRAATFSANARFYDIMGVDGTGVSDPVKGWASRIATSDKGRGFCGSAIHQPTGRIQVDHYHLVRDDATSVPVLEQRVVFRDALNQPARVAGMVTVLAAFAQTSGCDVDDAESIFRTFREECSNSVGIVDRDGVILHECPSVERLVGYKPHALVGRSLFDVVHPDEAGLVKDWLRTVLSTNAPIEVEYRHRTTDGKWRWLESIGRNQLENPLARGIVVNSRDVTDRRMWHHRIQESERLAGLGRLAATIAHEFNNVLMGIQPFAEALQRSSQVRCCDSSERPTCVSLSEHILRSVARGRRITQEILRFTHCAEPAVSRVEVVPWLDDLAPEIEGLLSHGVELSMHMPDETLAIAGDRVQLTQVITNLAINARDAMPVGGRLTIGAAVSEEGVHAEIMSGEAEQFVHITVSDEGCGIPLAMQHRIFEPLFTTKKSGTGLGLAVAHQIVTKHNGFLFVESDPGGGTIMHLLLPRDRADSPEADAEKTSMAEAPQGRCRGRNVRILLVEDDLVVAEGIKLLLEQDAYTVEHVSLGKEADAAITDGNPDVVVLDLGLPDINGNELYQMLVARYPGLGFIFSTGHGNVTELDFVVKNDLTGFLQKPYGSETLVALIDEIVSRREALAKKTGVEGNPASTDKEDASQKCIVIPERRSKRVPLLLGSVVALGLVALFVPNDPPLRSTSSQPSRGSATIAAPSARPPNRDKAPAARPYENREWQVAMEEMLRRGALPFPTNLKDLKGERDVLRGQTENEASADVFPAGIVVDETRPAFSWSPRQQASYTVTIFDGDREVARSESQRNASWTPTHPLRRGHVYVWQIEVRNDDGSIDIIPAVPAPPAKFSIVGEAAHRAISRALDEHPNDHLLLAVLYARAGLQAESLRELGRADRRDPAVQRLLERHLGNGRVARTPNTP